MAAEREFKEEVGINDIEIIKDKYFDMSYVFKDK
jgi:8-oxo-dGTP pyrophosphatase MutT (NUDIX family)